MDYRTAKQEMALLYPNTNSAPDASLDAIRVAADDARNAALSTGFSRVVGKLGAVARAVIELPRRRRVQNELRMLTDRELADIGLSRADVAHVYDHDFAARREAKVSSLAVSPRRARA